MGAGMPVTDEGLAATLRPLTRLTALVLVELPAVTDAGLALMCRPPPPALAEVLFPDDMFSRLQLPFTCLHARCRVSTDWGIAVPEADAQGMLRQFHCYDTSGIPRGDRDYLTLPFG